MSPDIGAFRPANPRHENTSITGTFLPGVTYKWQVQTLDTAGNVTTSPWWTFTTRATDTADPSVPGSLSATGGAGQVTLSWSASTDNVGVAKYSVHRSSTSGFTAAAGNKVGESTSTSFTNTGLAAGTYYYRVIALDAAGNDSASSGEASAAATAAALPAGLVAAYSFNEGAGTAVADASGSGNAGTVANAAWVAGKNGGALSFNGTNAKVTVPNSSSLQLTSQATFEMWVKPEAVGSWRTLLLKQRDGGASYSMYSSNTSGNPLGAHGTSAVGSSALPLSVWSHLAFTDDGTTMRLYVNGVQVAMRTDPAVPVLDALPLWIGGTSWGEYFHGVIDDVRIYNRALTAAEVAADMNAPVGGAGPGGTVAIGNYTFPIQGNNIDRPAEKMVVYKTPWTVSPANEWGAEAAVSSTGVVTALRDQHTTGPNPMAVPAGGYVLSGHGAGRLWLLANASVGASVTLSTG